MPDQQFTFSVRTFSRREKTCIRQDVKRFEKIGRDHGCAVLDDFVEFVVERTKRDEEGFLTQKSFELFRGLGAYFGDQLLRETTMSRIPSDVRRINPADEVTSVMAETNPGWLVADLWKDQLVIVPYLMTEHVFAPSPWFNSLDEVFDQIIDWNCGYLSIEDIVSPSVQGTDIELLPLYAA